MDDSTIDRLLEVRIEKRLVARLDVVMDRVLTRVLGGDIAPPEPPPKLPQAKPTSPARPSKRRAGPKATKTPAKRQKRTQTIGALPESASAPASNPPPRRRAAGPETPKTAILRLLEDGPLTAEEFAKGLKGIPKSVGTHEAKRQALARLAKSGTVQKLPNGGYQLARPT